MKISTEERDVLLGYFQKTDQMLLAHRRGNPAATQRLVDGLELWLKLTSTAAGLLPLGEPGDAVAYDPALHQSPDPFARGEPVTVLARGWHDAADDPELLRSGLTNPTVIARALVGREPAPDPEPPRTLLDVRVPQPGREAEYGVPPWVREATDRLYALRNVIPDEYVGSLDEAIFALLRPWTRE